jgi:hypothetical protein
MQFQQKFAFFFSALKPLESKGSGVLLFFLDEKCPFEQLFFTDFKAQRGRGVTKI